MSDTKFTKAYSIAPFTVSSITKYKFYVYVYIDPFTHLVRYIGKGTRDRASVHIRRALQGNYPIENKKLTKWIQSIDPMRPIVIRVATNLSETEAFGLEQILIETLRRNPKNALLNRKRGGTN